MHVSVISRWDAANLRPTYRGVPLAEGGRALLAFRRRSEADALLALARRHCETPPPPKLHQATRLFERRMFALPKMKRPWVQAGPDECMRFTRDVVEEVPLDSLTRRCNNGRVTLCIMDYNGASCELIHPERDPDMDAVAFHLTNVVLYMPPPRRGL